MSRRRLGAATLGIVAGAVALLDGAERDDSIAAITRTGDARGAAFADFARRFDARELLVVHARAERADALAEIAETLEGALAEVGPAERSLGPGAVFPDALAILEDPVLGADAEVQARVAARVQGPLGRHLPVLSVEPPSVTLFTRPRVDSTEQGRALVAALRRAEARLDDRAEVLAYGTPLVNLALADAAAAIDRRQLPLLVAVMVLLLGVALRSVRDLLAVLVPVGLAVQLAWVGLGLVGGTGNLIVDVARPLAAIVLLASALHVVVAFEHGRARGLDRLEAARHAAGAKQRALALALLTTGVGFASLGLSPLRPIQHFGLVASGALLVGAPLLLAGLPTLLGWFGGRAPRPSSPLDAGLERLLVAGAAGAVVRRRAVIAGAIGLAVAGALCAPGLRPQTDSVAHFPADHPLRTARDQMAGAGVPIHVVELLLTGPTAPPRLGGLDQVAAAARSHPGVVGRLDAAILAREARFRASGADPGPTGLDDRAALELLGAGPSPLEGRLPLTEGNTRRVSLLLDRPFEPGALRALEADLSRARDVHLPDAQLELTGCHPLVVLSQSNLRSTILWSLVATFATVELILLLVTGSVRLAAAAALPNLLPVAAMLAVMRILDLPLDVGTAMSFAVALGIAVDDTLHFLVAWQDEGTEAALRRTGRALVLSSLVIAAGFFTLLPTPFLPTRAFGGLVGVAVLVALAADLLLLPALLTPRTARGGRGTYSSPPE